jgi:hypothetical protein
MCPCNAIYILFAVIGSRMLVFIKGMEVVLKQASAPLTPFLHKALVLPFAVFHNTETTVTLEGLLYFVKCLAYKNAMCGGV